MDTNFSSNSHKSKENVTLPEKKVTKVIDGNVKVKKKSELHKLTDIIVAEDVSNVKSYIVMDVLIPALKKAISDIVTNGIDMLLYGEPNRSKKSNNGVSKISYRGYYDDRNDRRDSAPSIRKGVLDYDDLIFENRGQAEKILYSMEDILDQFGVVSIGDLYDLAGVQTSNYSINKYGWTDLRSAQVIRGRDGYLLKLPKAIPIT